jgi:arylsulfatase A-like enzyme
VPSAGSARPVGSPSRSPRIRRPSPPRRRGCSCPNRTPAFNGKIGETYKDSKPDYPEPVKAPKGAPNVLLILLDDVGFGMCSTFGGPVPTPHMQKLAENGLKYTRFHTTALCSPTRGALLAGRNHHSVATGVIIEMGTGYPGYTGEIPKNTALVSETLKCNGYATGMFGKWHNTTEPDISPAGPFNRWPTGLGFDYFYGFNQGETHQYYPVIYRGALQHRGGLQPGGRSGEGQARETQGVAGQVDRGGKEV